MATVRKSRAKLGTPTGVSEWEKLATLGDCQRLFRWCIHSIRNQTLDSKTAAVIAQIGCYVVAALKTQREMPDPRNFTDEELMNAVNIKIAAMENTARTVNEAAGLQ